MHLYYTAKYCPGVSHYDQLQYLFNSPFFQEVPIEEETIAKNIVKVFAEFVISG
jgi:hypothetical protein